MPVKLICIKMEVRERLPIETDIGTNETSNLWIDRVICPYESGVHLINVFVLMLTKRYS